MKTVSQMDSSDIGRFYWRTGSDLKVGAITQVDTIKREFTCYKAIHFVISGYLDSFNLSIDPQSKHVDVYRIGEGEELWLGDIHEPSIITLPPGRVHLYDRFKLRTLSEGDIKLTWVEFLIQELVDISEKELEDHFNSLQFVGG